jgi:hypothetical protein
MSLTLQVLALVLVSVAVALALAHALELPGKLRLSKETYLSMQPIYYPGFTIGGMVGEAGGLLTMLLLVLAMPAGTVAFWLTLGAFVVLLAMHAAYWLLIHPVNNFWLKDFKLEGASSRFFSFDPLRRQADARNCDWTVLRNRWEWSHVLRAGLGLISLTLLAAAVAL